MTTVDPVHPHALPTYRHVPCGVLLPAVGTAEAPRDHVPSRAWAEVGIGVFVAVIVAWVCMRISAHLFTGTGWVPVIAWESVWLFTAMLCAPFLPNGIVHDISWKSTLEGLILDWPELLYAAWVLGMMTMMVGSIALEPGPIGMSLAVGTAEEIVFRVLLLGWLVTKIPAPHALVVSSLVFGLAHLHEFSVLGLLSIAPQTAGGFVLGAVYLRTRNPIGPILAHAFWDFPYFMSMGAGVSGGGTEAGMPTIMSLVPWIAFAVYGLWLVRYDVPLVGRVVPVGSRHSGTW